MSQLSSIARSRIYALLALVGGGLIVAFVVAFVIFRAKVPTTETTRASVKISSKRERRFDDLNLNFDLPDGSWAELDAKKTNPDACIVLHQIELDIYFMIMAHRNPNDPSFDSAELAKYLQDGMRERNPNASFSIEQSEKYSQLDGVAFAVNGPVEGQLAHYAVWVAARNGFTYELVAYGSKQHTSEVDRTLKAMCSRLHQIDPDLVANSK